ncbi:MAG TPA: Fe-S cluster assembly protein SufD [Pyrinomonadaceae bacterium]|nr:Fe-S cluster assembly protein SufD [Pyrinomonadaceae bacterium]
MIELAKENRYQAAFQHLLQSRPDEPSWLRTVREDAFTKFERVGFPTVRDEDWKYTNVAPVAGGKFAPVIQNGLNPSLKSDVQKFSYPETENSRLVFINGIFQRHLTSMQLPEGVIVSELAEALRRPEYETLVREQLSLNPQANGFTALNTALFSSGAFVLIRQGVKLAAPIHLLFAASVENGSAPAVFPRIMVIAEDHSASTIVESYAGNGGAYLTDTVVNVAVGNGARIEHYKVQSESTAAFHIANTFAATGRDASYESTNINLGAHLSRHDIAVRFQHEGASCAVDGLYLIGGDQHSDTHSVIDHATAHCTSRQLYKGVLDGKSRAVFNGKVFVRHGAQQTDAQQTNKNLLLSEEARVDTKPQLEIFADDVKCTHGAAIGQLNHDELFYLESRGINPALARNMLTYGFAEEVIEKIKIDSIKRNLDQAVMNSLSFGLD